MRAGTSSSEEWWQTHEPVNQEWLATNFPCRRACPVHTNAGGYVTLIAQGRYREAYALARRPNPFASVCGRICAHPCEAACRRAEIDEAIQIRALKRVVTEPLGVESGRDFDEILKIVERPRPPADRPGEVAIIGAGPAGLSCAHDLALMGHRAVVFDAAPVAGGMLRIGVPAYRLPREVLQAEVDFVEHLGVEIRLGVEIGAEVTFEQLVEEHDAVFLATGCRKGRQVKVPGGDLDGVLTAVDFLAQVNLGVDVEIGQRVAVIGGGNVAYDVARTARRFGGTSRPDEEHHNLPIDAARVAARTLGRDVTMVVLESRDEMPADPEEIEAGAEEQIRLVNRRGLESILGHDGRVRAIRTLEVARVFDEEGRFAPEMREGTEEELECDTVITAVGQVADLSFLGDDPGLEVTPRSTVAVDRETLATSRPGVYAGGDVAFGPRIAIEAIADGRRAARAIDTQLTGRTDGPPRLRVRVFDTFGYEHPFAKGDYEKVGRRRLPMIPVTVRSQTAEVERPLERDEAALEGSRCLHCWVNTVFDSVAMNGTECIQCGGCVDVCPEQCIDLVSLVRIAAMNHGAALIKDETACIRCGLCARRCPTGVITMQAFFREDEVELMREADEVM